MFNRLAEWLDRGTGYRALIQGVLDGPIPGGARWRYSLGSALTTSFLIQVATGVLMMFTYTPSAEMAWGSVFYINEMMTLGWFIRGLHHFGSQATVILLLLHLLQVLVAGAYRAPREVNWWIGLVLLALVLGLSATGYQLPWDQKGYWSTMIAANFTGGVPVIGPILRKVVVGGTAFGNQTVTRFFTLHVAVMPGLVFFFLLLHILLFQRNGVTAPERRNGAGHYWPAQAFRDAVAGFLVLAVVAGVALFYHGATLDAPANPLSADYPARPEWYFLPLFQFLKYLPGEKEYIGTVIVPTAILALMALIPLLDKLLPRGLAHFLACGFVFGLLGGASYLLFQALDADARSPQYRAARAKADEEAKRAIALARDPEIGVPPDGSTYLLRRDPFTQGRAVLDQKCLSCHVFDGNGVEGSKQVASDLKDFGSRVWVRGLLENPSAPAYFGKVPQCGGMARWKKTSKLTSRQLDAVADLVATFAAIPDDMTAIDWLNTPGLNLDSHPGYEPFVKECGACHVLDGVTEGGTEDAPHLFAYGSPRWIRRMIHRPGADDLYGYLEPKDQMPAFPGDQVSENDLTALIRFLKNDYLGGPGKPSHASSGTEARQGK